MRTISKSFGLENSRSHVKVERKKCKSEWAGGGAVSSSRIKKNAGFTSAFSHFYSLQAWRKNNCSSIAQLLHDFIYCNSERMKDRVFISH